MNEIAIVVNYDNEKPTVSGRELHKALMIETRYNDWFKRMCDYGFAEGQDFYSILSKTSECGRPSTDHTLTIDMAKELCMIQRTEIGKRCREYFLTIERHWNSPEAIMARALQFANQRLELIMQQNNELLETNSRQAKQIAEMQPKATYYDVVLNCPNVIPISTIAKDYGKSAVWLNKWLHDHEIQYRQGKVWLLYQKYADKGYTKSKTYTIPDDNGDSQAKTLTCWTTKGRLFLYDLLKSHGILPLIEQDTADDEA